MERTQMMMTRQLHIFATLCVVCSALSAAESATVIPAFDRFGRASHAGPVVSGLVLFDALNCASCHTLDGRQSLWITPKRAPDLASIGSRTNPEWLQGYLESPADAVPGVRMPDVLHAFSEGERRVAAEAIVLFLRSQSPQTFQRIAPDRAAITRGENLFHSVGCVACHAPQKAELKGTVSNSQVLPRMSEKWAFDPLRRFVLDPRSIRPDGRMPSLRLSDNEAADIAHYLLRETQVAGILECSLYRGQINSLDQLEDAEWAWSGHVNDFSLDRVRRERNYALRFSGFIRAEQDAAYTFYLKSGGDSRIRIDGSLVAEARNNHSSASGTIHLSAGWHEITVEYLDHGSEALIKLEWEAPGITRQPISSAMLRTTREAVSEPPKFVVDPPKAKDGRAHFAAMGCAACHDMKDIPKPVPPRNLSALQRGGCLAEHPGAGSPDFHLDAAQRDALSAALAALQSPTLREPSAKQKLAHSLLSVNCYACHSREKMGGASGDRNALFTSNVGDYTLSIVMRAEMEQVNGVYQGACFPFRQGFATGLISGVLTEKGQLYVGGSNRGWPARGISASALQRVDWTGRMPFEVLSMHVHPSGFYLRFSAPVDAVTASNTASYSLDTFTYMYHAGYGSPEMEPAKQEIVSATPAVDGLSVKLVVNKLVQGHIHELHLPGIKDRAGQKLLHDAAYYTLNQIPGGNN